MTIELNEAKVTILADILWQNRKNEYTIFLKNKAQRQVLWNLECLGEKQLSQELDAKSAEAHISQEIGDF